MIYFSLGVKLKPQSFLNGAGREENVDRIKATHLYSKLADYFNPAKCGRRPKTYESKSVLVSKMFNNFPAMFLFRHKAAETPLGIDGCWDQFHHQRRKLKKLINSITGCTSRVTIIISDLQTKFSFAYIMLNLLLLLLCKSVLVFWLIYDLFKLCI